MVNITILLFVETDKEGINKFIKDTLKLLYNIYRESFKKCSRVTE